MPSTEYARLRQLWTRYQGGDPAVTADTIRDHTSMDGIVVFDSLGRSSEQSDFEDGLRRPWEVVSAWANSAANRGIIRQDDRLAASVELWETGVLFYQLDAQRRPILRSFAGLEPLTLAQAAELNQHPEAVQSSVLTIGGVFTGTSTGAGGGGMTGPASMEDKVFLSLSGLPSSPVPVRQLAEFNQSAPVPLAFTPQVARASSSPPWLLLALIAGGLYWLTR
ncbi:MAG TPA: hypothetical protein VJ842_14350 [Pyrinomonadaceae bacterium]|nr:hypothetical protein [Pyrinomonadaceae bacterium]